MFVFIVRSTVLPILYIGTLVTTSIQYRIAALPRMTGGVFSLSLPPLPALSVDGKMSLKKVNDNLISV